MAFFLPRCIFHFATHLDSLYGQHPATISKLRRKESKIQYFFFHNLREGHRPQVSPTGYLGCTEAAFSRKMSTFSSRRREVILWRGERYISFPTLLRDSFCLLLAVLIAFPKGLKSYFSTSLFAILIYPITFYCLPFFLDMSIQFPWLNYIIYSYTHIVIHQQKEF